MQISAIFYLVMLVIILLLMTFCVFFSSWTGGYDSGVSILEKMLKIGEEWKRLYTA